MSRAREFVQEEVLQSACEVFRRKGYAATSVQDLVDSTGVKRQSLYNVFGDKHSFFLAALDWYQNKELARIRRCIDETVSVKAALRRIFDAMIEDVESRRRDGCFIVNSTIELGVADPEVGKRAHWTKERMEEMLEQMIRKAQKIGQIGKNKHPRRLARMIYNSFLGLRVTAKTTDDPAVMRDIAEGVLSLL